jgi:hypothetical protein
MSGQSQNVSRKLHFAAPKTQGWAKGSAEFFRTCRMLSSVHCEIEECRPSMKMTSRFKSSLKTELLDCYGNPDDENHNINDMSC